MRIRMFDEQDTDAVVRLWRDAGVTRPWNDPYRDIRRKTDQQPELFLVAEDDGAVVGAVMAGYDGHRGWINYLAVDRRHRGSGLGSLLVHGEEKRLMALGCPKIQLQVRPDNAQVVDFYRALGYETFQTIDMGKRIIDDTNAQPAATVTASTNE